MFSLQIYGKKSYILSFLANNLWCNDSKFAQRQICIADSYFGIILCFLDARNPWKMGVKHFANKCEEMQIYKQFL